ncbi:MAG: hypothetical protein ACI8ZM_005056 [Crocinitomix sp.]|jgi:hypothetical protein
MKYYLSILTLLLSLNLLSQSTDKNKPNPFYFGIEQDVLPYFLKGYILTGWTGRDFMRCRFSYAQATNPKFILADGISYDRVKAFGISFEYFFKENFEGFWLGPGIGYWTNNVTGQLYETGVNESVIFTFGGGYNFRLTNWLYFSPWVAGHTRVSGTAPLSLISTIYKPAIFTPELSIKLGIKFPVKAK